MAFLLKQPTSTIPPVSLLETYRVFFPQWRIAFEIGARNRRMGHRLLPLGQFVALLTNSNTNALSTGGALNSVGEHGTVHQGGGWHEFEASPYHLWLPMYR